MLKLFYYIFFYQYYKIFKVAKNGIEEWSAIITISILETMNIATMLLYKGFSIKSTIIFPLLIIMNYYILIREKRYEKIIKRQKNEEKRKIGLIRLILTFTYTIISVKLFFMAANW